MNKKTIVKGVVALLYLLVVAGCADLSAILYTPTPPPGTPMAATPTFTPLAGETPQENTPMVLTVWIPPVFDPANNSQAGDLLMERLDQYTQQHPGYQISLRVKSQTGTASIINSLNTANEAAPLTLPDLVVLTSGEMQIAAVQELIYPLDLENLLPGDTDWYEIAIPLSTYQEQVFGLPFAANAMVMAYKTSMVETPPQDWSAALESGYTLHFPAADQEALFTLGLYLSTGSSLSDANGEPSLDTAAFEKVLDFYAQAQTVNLMPYWLTQYTTNEMSWTSFLESQDELAITWSDTFLQQANINVRATTLPSETGVPFTIASGWVWAIANPDPRRQVAAAELAAFISEAEFTGPWTQAVGLLPLRPSALTIWESGPGQSLASQLLPVAIPLPGTDDLALFGKPISDAVTKVLKQELTPQEASLEAAKTIAP